MNILIGVSGSIACYKAPEIIRRLRDSGHDVRVVMTKSAKFFVSDIVFQAISGNPVRSDLWDKEAERAMSHIELARWCDCILIAPSTAHSMATLAMGMANDLLSTICITTEAPVFIAPSMNHAMWNHPSTQLNIQLLKQKDVTFIGPDKGPQACGEHGWGRMSEPNDIVKQLESAIAHEQKELFKGIRILVTAGPTREPIDPVRYITNRSSGKMGFAIAQALSALGAGVTLVSGPVELDTPSRVIRINIETSKEMLDTVMSHAKDVDIIIACAAVCDYFPKEMAEHKIKSNHPEMMIELQKTTDILKSVKLSNEHIFTVGFAAETKNLSEYALKKLKDKGANMIVGNLVGKGIAFDQDSNALSIYTKAQQIDIPFSTKTVLARQLSVIIKNQYVNWKEVFNKEPL